MGKLKLLSLMVSIALLVLHPEAGRALTLQVTLDTSPLIGHLAQPFFVEFQLDDGSGLSDANNTAFIENFDFGGGSPGLTISHTGGALGSLDTAVTLTDSSFFNQFFQEFVPGNTLSFEVTLSTVVDAGPQPDQFSFALLDCVQTELPTTSPANALLAVNIGAPVTVETFAGNPGSVLVCTGGPGIPLAAPRVTVIPEPQTLWLVALGALGLLFVQHRFRR